MMISKNQSAKFRHRGFKCVACGFYVMVFGDEAAPVSCPECPDASTKGMLTKEWDHMVTETVHVEDYVAPAVVPETP